MKKKIIIGISALAVVAIGVLFYLYMTFFNGTDFSKNVPKNALFVMKVDLMGMGKKIDLKEATESKLFRKEILDNLKSSQKDLMEKIMSNPTKSGLQLASDPTLFVYNNSKSEAESVMGFMFGVADKKNFNDFLSELNNDLTISEPDNEGFYKATLNGDEKMVLYFNDKVGLALLDIDNKEVPFKRIRDEIVSLKKDESILSNEEYKSINKQSNDIMVYLNATELTKIIEINNKKQAESINKILEAFPYALTLNFNEDAISMKMFGGKSKDKDAVQIYNEGGFAESELKNIDPKGSPLAYLTMNLNFKKIIDLINEQASTNMEIADFFAQVENLASELNIPKDNLLNVFDGKMSVSFSGMKPANYSDTLLVFEPAVPFINAWAQLGNKEAATKVLDLMVSNGALTFNDGIYAEYSPYRTPGVYMAIKGNDFFLSTQEENIQSKLNGKDWNALKEDYGKKDILSKSATVYADLRYSSYKSLLKANMNEFDLAAVNKFENILSSFKSVSITGDRNEFEMVIQFSEKKTNSLQRIIEMLQEAYSLAS